MKTIHINGVAYRPATLQEVAKGLAIWCGNLFVVPLFKKTRKLNKDVLYRLAYGSDAAGYVIADMWIDFYSDIIFKVDSSTSSYVFRRVDSSFEVYVRKYRKRDWTLLFYSSSARSVLQDLYDFLFC